MRAPLYIGWSLAAMLGIVGCNRAESPAAVQHDVDKSMQSADRNTDAAAERANTTTTDATVDAALAAADGDRKVALAQCEALAGDAQKACKEQAEAKFDLAKANAKALKADHS